MQLSAELFAQVVRQLKGGMRDERDKRHSPRVGIRNRVGLTPISLQGNGPAVSVRVRDLSPHGIGLLHDRPMRPDSHFAIRLPLRGRPDLTANYVVEHCHKLGSDLYGIGGSLQRINDPCAHLAAATAK